MLAIREVTVIYLERLPYAKLRPFVQVLWYARDGHLTPRRERVLPTGCVQVILNLSRGFLLDCPQGSADRRMPPSLVEEVGLSPKAWCRVQRFQQAVRLLHAGADLRWAELALECGYYDQSHFANEFRAFSGVDATTYSAGRTRWANHITVD